MSREMGAIGAVVGVAAITWVVLEWPVRKEGEAGLEAAPSASAEPASPRTKLPVPVAAPAPPVAPVAEPEEPDPEQEEVDPEPVAPPPSDLPRHVRMTPEGRQEIDEFMKGEQGPVAEYRAKYRSEPRDFAAAQVEETLRAAFLAPRAGRDLVRSISCRETICRLELRWSMDRRRAYMDGVSRTVDSFQQPLAMAPIDPPDGLGVRTVEVFMKRKPPRAAGERQPSHHH